MSLTKRVGLAVGTAALTLTGASFGNSNEADNQDLRAKVAELEAKLAKLETQNGDQWMTEARASEIRSLVQDVLQDADTRTSLLQGGGGAGYDGSFFLASADGNFRLNVDGQLQSRYMLNYIDTDAGSSVDSTRAGFEVSRAKLVFSGHVVNPSWTYKVEGDFSSRAGSDGTFTLEDAWINYDYGNGWGMKFGQFRLPFAHEELVHSSKQLAVERSLVNAAFTAYISQGLMAHYQGDQFRFAVAYSDGLGGANSAALAYDTEYAFTARGEVLFSGNWDQFDDFTSWNGEDTGFMLGAAIHYEDGEYGTTAVETQTTLVTVDGSLEFGGANLYGAFMYADFDTTGSSSFNPWAFLVQGGLFLNDEWELFGRFEYGDSDIAGDDDLLLLTVGVNDYIAGHDVKWTTDFGYAFDGVSSFWGSSSDAMYAGWRTSGEDEDQFVIRTQLQLLF